jgi:predicted dehydrogenase
MQQDDRSKRTDREMSHFLDCIESNSMPFTNAEDALQSLRVIWRLYEAEKAGRVGDLRRLGVAQASIPASLQLQR